MSNLSLWNCFKISNINPFCY